MINAELNQGIDSLAAISVNDAAIELSIAQQEYDRLLQLRFRGTGCDAEDFIQAQQSLVTANQKYHSAIEEVLRQQADINSRPSALDVSALQAVPGVDRHLDNMLNMVGAGYEEMSEDGPRLYEAVFFGSLHNDHPNSGTTNPHNIAVFMPVGYSFSEPPQKDDYRIMLYEGPGQSTIVQPSRDSQVQRRIDSSGEESLHDEVIFKAKDGPNFYRLAFRPKGNNGPGGHLEYFKGRWDNDKKRYLYESSAYLWLVLDEQFHRHLQVSMVGQMASVDS